MNKPWVLTDNPFEWHGIPHLSASTCNLFATSPSLFVLEKVLKIKSPVGCAAHRGTASEDGIVAGLLDPGKTDEECCEIALAKFRSLAALSRDPNKAKEAAAVPNIVKQGLKELRPYGVPTTVQGKIEHQFEGVLVPFIGYYDLFYEGHGILTDIKTQLRLTGKIKSGHARQVALYKTALGDNIDARITYVSDKKAATYSLENYREHLKSLHSIALSLQHFLAISKDPQDLVRITAPDTDHFFFNDPVTRQNVFEVWGI